ncbi:MULTISPECIES: ABC transporter permease [unclassified Rhodococcus (in: high G+C Gram-positive bacteria)]|uniref:ABC transporter permease n=1 Tax=unclassified Rhodococcus (in: high G+C Gram-positive bacteria) TaxID=192944 RepID=UPI0007BBC70A|nr:MULTISPECIES: ABC transporter permease [unclassified Rhodococcus (in: high G+C Gram-positive bacteria)]KZF01178.1 peptide ABC transporter permease [Rhodococcus sp. EPR-279]KZF02388.1 peptide ABC transporter permease [Rhodococcus sp. EPR-147]OZE19260.1 peptide ABC transporter permease [Rhodococcus sp. 05-2254-6]OZE38779.1 peptide ABC transporter permease [Rhodococcus sp. 05-2254-4]OZE46377.1 peptide ABC transporter permease [Rhodococcus sp. 05-2254-3]
MTMSEASVNTTRVSSLTFPEPNMVLGERSVRALWTHSLIQAKRLLTRWMRDPSTMIQALLYPALMLVMFRVVLGNSISAATGAPAIYGQVPMIALVGAMFGSIVSAVGLKGERKSGLLSRFWTTPTHRAAGLLGRMIAEAVRVLVTTIVITLAGVAMGFRFTQGIPAGILLILVPIVFGIGFAVMVTFLATVAGDAPLVEVVSIFATLLMFFNAGFVPVLAYPPWLQPVVAAQPMSVAVDAMRNLAMGGPVLTPVLQTLAWSLGMAVVFLIPAIRGYKKASSEG